nr:DUF1673 domain-containing protein [Methanosarcina horonobensis]
MGWCPYAKTLETRHSTYPEYLEAENQSRGRDGGNTPLLPSGWWNRRRNRSLIESSVLTIFSVYWVAFQRESLQNEAFMPGLIFGIFFNLLFCIWNWSYLDDIKNSSRKIKIITVPSKLRVINLIIFLALLYLLFSQFNWGFVLFLISAFCLIALLYYFKLDLSPLVLLLYFGSRIMAVMGFMFGTCLTAFLYYLTDVYWEKKNHMKIYIKFENSLEKIYAIGEKEGKLWT